MPRCRAAALTPDRLAARTAGFTLLEALLALALSALVLALALSITLQVQGASRRLDRRTGAAGEDRITIEDAQAVLAAFVLPPPTPLQGVLVDANDDDDFAGSADRLDGWLSLLRDGFCGQRGTNGRGSVRLRSLDGRAALECRLHGQIQTLGLPATWTRMDFSEDGLTWKAAWTVRHGQPVADSARPDQHQRGLYVRVSDAEGRPGLLVHIQSLPPDSGELRHAPPAP